MLIMQSVLVLSLGASLGALTRWLLGLALNNVFAHVPLGTLAANLLGGYLIGLTLGLLLDKPELGPLWRLFILTGFLGALTTFSTFSAEVVLHLQQGRLAWAGAVISLHLFGSLLMTLLGLASFSFLKNISF